MEPSTLTFAAIFKLGWWSKLKFGSHRVWVPFWIFLQWLWLLFHPSLSPGNSRNTVYRQAMDTSSNILPDLQVVATLLWWSTPLIENCTHLYVPYCLFFLLSVRYDYIALSSELTRTARRPLLPSSSSLVSSSVALLILLFIFSISSLILSLPKRT